MRWPGQRGRRIARPRRRIAQGVVLTMIGGLLAALAIQHDGSPIHDVDLNDGGVWVTNGHQQMMARLNSQVKELEMGILTSATSDTVFQEGISVQVFDDGGGNADSALRIADPVTGTAASISMPGSFVAAAARDTAVIADRDTGRVWVRRIDQLDAFTETTPADYEVAPRSAILMSRSGTALVADRPTGTVTAYRLDETGAAVQQDTFDFDTPFTDQVAFTAVGETPVALQEGTLLRPGQAPLRLSGTNPVLQEAGPSADHVHVATSESLLRVPLSGGDPEERSVVSAVGPPAAPTVVAGCVHAAWVAPGSDNYQRQCGDQEPFVTELTPLSHDAQLVFRSNRDVVVINDFVNGGSWLVEDNGVTYVDNWPSVHPNPDDPQTAEASDEQTNTKRNRPPIAVDDEFGARPGSTVILPVTLNDIDPDGDILTLTGAPASTRDATFSVTGGGTQVQARIEPTASGTITFDYEITDGHPANPPSTATVTLTIYDNDVDEPPFLIKGQKNELTVATGHEASVNVLPGWIDPEGDSLVLRSASSEGGRVGFRPDGTIDFRDNGDGRARKTIEFEVQGGEAVATGTVDVRVVDPANARPTVVPDRFAGLVGSTILLDPLANDTDPLGGQLTMPRLQVVAGGAANLTQDPDGGTATFRTDRHGTYYLEYEAASSNGQVSDPALIRVDVSPRGGANRPPVTTRNVAALRSDGSVLVDVLSNDIDPDGDVLVVQGVQIPPRWQETVTASVINKRFVRVEVSGDLDGAQPEFEYLVSDGYNDQVTGTVSVVQADNVRNRPPVAREYSATVRAGTVVTVPVTDNDDDPDGDPLTVYQQDLFDVDPNTDWIADGEVPIVATGSGIRIMVPDDGTTQMQIGYGVRDPYHARADSRLVLNIKPDDPENNRAPEPRPIEDRAISGQRLRVPVDVFGSDPDGDPVVFTGVVEPPELGRIVQSGANWFEYEPFVGPKYTGTDQFRVLVTDPYGASGIADVRIGVASRSPENQPPAALDDRILVKPGITLQYPVLQNDSDPDGDPLILEADKLAAPPGVNARVVGEFVELDVPELGDRTEVNVSALYSVTDGLGMSSTALLTVTAREDAPDHAPVAGDDVVTADQMAGKGAGETVDVDVLDNDGDLDGSKDALVLEAVPDTGAEVVDGQLRITLEADSRIVPYKITDATDQFTFGFVYVAGTANMAPQLNTAAVPLEVVAGEDLEIDLEDVVVVREDRTPKVARTDRISVSNGDATAQDLETLVFQAPPAYHGPASVTLDVIDGEDLNDPTGLESQITIPITVLPAENVPPEVRSTSVVLYAGGEARTIDLERLATDANGDDLSYRVEGERNGVVTRLADDLLEVSARANAPEGEVTLDVLVSDGTAEPVVGYVRVTVISSGEGDEEEAPPLQLIDLRIADGVAGETTEVDVRDAVTFDPFPDDAKTVTWTSAIGPANRPTASGSTIAVTPSAAGEVEVTYRLDDGSGDRSREIEGRILIVVADVPEAPTAPTAVEGGPDSVQLTWLAPDDQGSPIQHYLVRQDGEVATTECVATRCTIDGLDPGQEYRFTVAAVNGVGEGPESPASVPVTPDTVPDAMTAPVVTEGDYDSRDGQLHLSWTPGSTQGSAITSYELESSPATTARSVPGDQTDLTWQGLANGTNYRFRIRAVNDRGEAVWSPWSDAHTPFTEPDQMPAPELTATNAGRKPGDAGYGDGYLAVRWSEPHSPADGHDKVTQYEVEVYQDGQPYATKPATGTSTDFTVENGHSYTATVRAQNRAGWSEWSGQSGSVITWDRASAVTNIRKDSDCVGCRESITAYKGRVEFRTPSDNGGYPVTKYLYETQDGRSGTWSNLDQREGVTVTAPLPFATSNQGQSVTITPVTQPSGMSEQTGTPHTGGTFNPYAKPKRVVMENVQRFYRGVRFDLVCDGNGRPVNRLEATRRVEGSTLTFDSCTRRTVEYSPLEGGVARCLTTAIRTADGGWSDPRDHPCVSAQDPTIDVTALSRTCSGQPCYRFRVVVGGFLSDTSYDMEMVASGGAGPCNGDAFSTASVRTNRDGRGTAEPPALTWYISERIDGQSCSRTRMTVTIASKTRNGDGDPWIWTGSVVLP